MSNGVDNSTKPREPNEVGSTVATSSGPKIVSPQDAVTNGTLGAHETLETIVTKAGRLSPAEALRYLKPLVSILGDLHATHQAHGSLTPELVRVFKGNDGTLRLQILKSRISATPGPDANPKASLTGSMVLYSSPAQIQGSSPADTDDMYSIAHIAYMTLVGEPYWAEEVDKLGFMTFCKAIMGGLPEAPSVRAMRRKRIRLPQDFDAWFVLSTDRQHPDRFPDITDSGLALTSVLSNPDLRELSRSVQFKFNPNILDMPAQPLEAPPPAPENLRLTAIFTIIVSLAFSIAIVLVLRWSIAKEHVAPSPSSQPPNSSEPSNEPR